MLQVISDNILCGLRDVSGEEVPKVWSAWSALEYLNYITHYHQVNFKQVQRIFQFFYGVAAFLYICAKPYKRIHFEN